MTQVRLILFKLMPLPGGCSVHCMLYISCVLQIENEFGFVGPNEKYMRHLLNTAQASLGSTAIIYTRIRPQTLPRAHCWRRSVQARARLHCQVCLPCVSCHSQLMASVLEQRGGLGAGWFDLNRAFSQQKAMNAPGKSPPMCSEF